MGPASMGACTAQHAQRVPSAPVACCSASHPMLPSLKQACSPEQGAHQEGHRKLVHHARQHKDEAAVVSSHAVLPAREGMQAALFVSGSLCANVGDDCRPRALLWLAGAA